MYGVSSDLGLGTRIQYNKRIQTGLQYTEKAKELADSLTSVKHQTEISLKKQSHIIWIQLMSAGNISFHISSIVTNATVK